ncbi:hypothetical protein JCM8547_002924 [Rhodosporidiobolus lusitaniae]
MFLCDYLLIPTNGHLMMFMLVGQFCLCLPSLLASIGVAQAVYSRTVGHAPAPVLHAIEDAMPLLRMLDKTTRLVLFLWNAITWPVYVLYVAGLCILQVSFYISPLILLAATWAVIFYESYKAYCVSKSNRNRSLRQFSKMRNSSAFEADFFPRILRLPSDEKTRPRETGGCQPGSTTLPFVLDTPYALSGILMKYILRLPSLKHLERSFHLAHFLPVLHPLICLVVFHIIHDFASAGSHISPAKLLQYLSFAVLIYSDASISTLQEHEHEQAMVAFCEAMAPDPSFPALERRVQGAILDVIYEWKERKEEVVEEEEQQRLKQE